MKCLIERLSECDPAVKPIAGAVHGRYVGVDRYHVKRPEDLQQPTGWWYDEGRNHRVENSQITRDRDAEGWVIEIAGLDDLMVLAEKGERLIVTVAPTNPACLSIVIYDDYNE